MGAGYRLEDAIGTSLVTFTVAGIIATVIYGRRSAIDWRSAALTSAGSIIGGPIGAKLSVWLPERIVSGCFAAFLLLTGVTTLWRRSSPEFEDSDAPQIGSFALIACGISVGVGSGLTGIGGPAILVPLLLLLRLPSSVAVGISQPNAIAASASGAVGHLIFGRIDVPLAVFLSLVAGAGVAVGSVIHKRIAAESLRKIVGTACVVLGLWLGYQFFQTLRGR